MVKLKSVTMWRDERALERAGEQAAYGQAMQKLATHFTAAPESALFDVGLMITPPSEPESDEGPGGGGVLHF